MLTLSYVYVQNLNAALDVVILNLDARECSPHRQVHQNETLLRNLLCGLFVSLMETLNYLSILLWCFVKFYCVTKCFKIDSSVGPNDREPPTSHELSFLRAPLCVRMIGKGFRPAYVFGSDVSPKTNYISKKTTQLK